MFDSQVLAFIVVAAALTVTPGADTMLVLRNVLQGSQRDGIITTFGICAGLFVHALLSGLGVSIILMHSATLFQVVKPWARATSYGSDGSPSGEPSGPLPSLTWLIQRDIRPAHPKNAFWRAFSRMS